ncbi:hypothetical protein [Paenibacillus alkalitolerans]|uniref:hypothetical protein n=1 Tax=Paenibacillus alkalitolerans TaxID=2799335 RepID=UPI0018F4B8F2|nr:hypothetical protein [Paenibacillus alkalitolerans]
MKKYTLLNVILSTMVGLGMVISLLIAYKDIDTPLAFKFLVGYVIYLVLYALYLTSAILINMRKLTWIEISKRLFTFIISFIFLSGSLFLFNYIFRPSEIDVGDLIIPLGLSVGIAFFDLMIFGKKDN